MKVTKQLIGKLISTNPPFEPIFGIIISASKHKIEIWWVATNRIQTITTETLFDRWIKGNEVTLY